MGIKIKNRIIEYCPNEKENKVINTLYSDEVSRLFSPNFVYIDSSTWSNFKEINRKIKQVKESVNDEEYSQYLKNLKKRLNFSIITEMKDSIKIHYDKQLSSRGVSYCCFYCERDLLERNRVLTGELDHILYKNNNHYRHYMFTPFNLIVSCSFCNSTLKKQTDFGMGDRHELRNSNHYPIIHPFLDNKSDHIEKDLRTDIYQVKYIVQNKNRKYSQKGEYFIDFFQLNEVRFISNSIVENEVKQLIEEGNKLMDEIIAKSNSC